MYAENCNRKLGRLEGFFQSLSARAVSLGASAGLFTGGSVSVEEGYASKRMFSPRPECWDDPQEVQH